jgi:hypothetical protein
VGIDAERHQRGQFDGITGDTAHNIGHQAGGGDNTQLFAFGQGDRLQPRQYLGCAWVRQLRLFAGHCLCGAITGTGDCGDCFADRGRFVTTSS